MVLYSGPTGVTPRVLGPEFGETAYISEVNRDKKVMSDAQIAMNKNSDPVHKFFLRGGWGGRCPQLQFFQNSGIV